MKRVWPTFVQVENPAVFDGSSSVSPITLSASGHISRLSSLPGFVLVSRNIDGGLYYLNIDRPSVTHYVGNSHHGKRLSTDVASKTALGVDINGEMVATNGKQDYLREPRASASSSGRYIFFVSDYHIHENNYAAKPELMAYLNMIDLSQ